MMTWPKPVQKPHPPVILGGAFRGRRGARCATATAGIPTPAAAIPRNTCRASGRWRWTRAATRIAAGDLGGAPEDADKLKRFRDLGAVRVNVTLPAESADQILPVLDRWAKLIPRLQ